MDAFFGRIVLWTGLFSVPVRCFGVFWGFMSGTPLGFGWVSLFVFGLFGLWGFVFVTFYY